MLLFVPRVTVSTPKILAILSIILVFTFLSTYDTLFSSTYQAIVHCLYLMKLFDMYQSYRLILNLRDSNVFLYRSYHSNAEYMNPNNSFSNRRYSIFTPFSIQNVFVFWIHPTQDFHKLTLNFNMINSTPGMSSLRYAPGISKMATFLPLCASIVRLENYIVGDYASSLGMYTVYSPRFPLQSHSLVCIKNNLFIVGIGPILSKKLGFIYRSDCSDRTFVYS